MKFLSFKKGDAASWGISTDGGVIDLGKRLPQYPGLRAYIEGGLPDVSAHSGAAPDYAEADITFLPPIPDPAHIWCIALNYVEHHNEVERSGRIQELPKEPALFARYIESFAGHGEPLEYPRVSEQFDFEGELGVVIGRGGREIAQDGALTHVAGYTIVNDGSVRDWQFHTRQIISGKNFFASGAIGPYFVPAADVGDPYSLTIRTTLNGEVVQEDKAGEMVHRIEKQIAYLSTILPLMPGDIIATGTPSGVGFSREPKLFMKPGDLCEVEIDGLGKLSNTVRRRE